jgi:hypothetical protein
MTSFDAFAYGARGSFAGVPKATLDDLGDARIVIVGAPFDLGTTNRPGARFGPKAIRDSDYLDADGARPHLDTGIDPLATLGVVDIGDIQVVPGYMDESIERIRAVVGSIAEHGAIPLVLGGDHTITSTLMLTPTLRRPTTENSTVTGHLCGASSNRVRSRGIASYRSVFAAIGPRRRWSPGWASER